MVHLIRLIEISFATMTNEFADAAQGQQNKAQHKYKMAAGDKPCTI